MSYTIHSTRLIPKLKQSIRLYSSKTPSNSAAVLPSPPSSGLPPPPPPAQLSTSKPQPFIPKPLSRKYQISTLSQSPSPLTSSTTINLIGPNALSLSLPNLFLRDSSHHPDHLHPSSQQKLFKTSDIPLGIGSELKGYGVHEIKGEDCLVMEWSEGIKGVATGSEKLSVHPISFLLKLAKKGTPEDMILPSAQVWNQFELVERLHKTPYTEYTNSTSSLQSTLSSLLQDGIVFVEGVPNELKEGHATTLKEVVERIGSIRKTWYGDLWDVKAEKGSRNIAYTNLDLGLHMDLTHFESPPRYQFLHSLLNTSIKGGLSYFVDSYYIASLIQSQDPTAFKTLCTEPVLFEYNNGGYHTRFERPTIELNKLGEIIAVNYSPPFQGPLLLPSSTSSSSLSSNSIAPTTTYPFDSTTDEDRLISLHQALSLFSTLSSSPENQFHIQLTPGDCVIFDNRRVLHARTAFEFEKGVEENEGGGRWLKGAYMDGDELKSRFRVLEAERKKGKLN